MKVKSILKNTNLDIYAPQECCCHAYLEVMKAGSGILPKQEITLQLQVLKYWNLQD